MSVPGNGKLTARLLLVGPHFVTFELTIYDPSIAGELILPYRQFTEFMREQNVELVAETEEERIMLMKLNDTLAEHNLSLNGH
jgi:hypothetical protein